MLNLSKLIMALILIPQSVWAFVLIEVPVQISSIVKYGRVSLSPGWYAYPTMGPQNHSFLIPQDGGYIEAREGLTNKILVVTESNLNLASLGSAQVTLEGCSPANPSLNLSNIQIALIPAWTNAFWIFFSSPPPNVAKYELTINGVQSQSGSQVNLARRFSFLIGDVDRNLVVDAQDDSRAIAISQLCLQFPGICNPINPNDPVSGYIINYDVQANFAYNSGDRQIITREVNAGQGAGIGRDLRNLNCP